MLVRFYKANGQEIPSFAKVKHRMEGTLTLEIFALISIVLSALVAGMFCGPWVALSQSINTFQPEVFLPIVQRMSRNMAPVMTILMPAVLLSMSQFSSSRTTGNQALSI
jgi:hypothetical protein